ncbi:uncharacterized protein LOC129618211 [Condylostylus longicornis]|uniref:uncharacterized protein LOC129618211 n=1 Tax=Condylostylus longicornis TaxID=2530218 RepID=UPI00244E311E|nr:uncharacterized protein LOC129618211 [Condylostylus longicornis]
MYQNLRRLINVIDELRDVGLQQYINLPRICVVGTQSAGKSSVLEAIVGMDFLPRGEGIVTRRPLELRLVHEPSSADESWAMFEARKNKKYTNFEEVRKVIDELTEEVAGKNKAIVDAPIILTVHSPKCPDLTLIDLPGITRVPLKGSDQTDDIERLTRDMATRYAKDPRTIILAVVAANADMSTSDALQLARRVDPKGIRTIGVITKIDLMDRGTDASRMLMGDEVPLRLGYTGVRNRSQQDIRDNKTIEEALKSEKDFFSSHPVYRSLAPHMLGTQSLVEKLTRVLFRHIRTYLPEIKREIGNRMRSVQNRLDELGSGVPIDSQERVQLMWSMITDYCEVYRNTIRGKFDKKLQTYFEHHDITSGAQIRSIFNELLLEYVSSDVTSEMTDYDIDLAIRMHEGDSLPGFPSPDTFEYLILPHLRKVQAPVFDCLDRVTQSLELLSQTIANRVFGRFPKLSEQVLEQSSVIIAREKENTKQILENIVAAETGYLFTNDSTYLTQHGSMIPMNDKQPQLGKDLAMTLNDVLFIDKRMMLPSSSDPPTNVHAFYNSVQNTVSGMWMGNEKKKTHYSASFIKEIRERLDAYFGIVLRNIRDSVPKVIGCFLVRQLQDKLQFELYNDLNKAERLSDLLGEPPQIMEERQCLVNQIATLKKATQVLQRDPSITALAISEFDELYDADLAQLQQQSSHGRVPSTGGVHAASPAQLNGVPHGVGPQGVAGVALQGGAPLGAQSSPPPQPPSAANLWGLRSGSGKTVEPKKPGGSLFGDRPNRASGTDNMFADPKVR